MNPINAIVSKIINIEEIARQSIISFFGQVAVTIIGFVSTIYFARTLGASVLGAYFLFLAYFNVIAIVNDGGLGGAAIKRISENEEQDAYFSTVLFLRFLFTSITVVALFIFRDCFVDLNSSGVFIWLIVALIFSTLRGPLYNGIAGRGKMGIHAIGTHFGEISRTIFQIAAVFLGYGIGGLIGGFIAGMIVGTLVILRFFDLHLARFEYKHIKNISTFSFWLFLTSGGLLMYSYTDRIIIGYYLNNTDVGVYQIAVQLAAFSSFAVIALRSTLWPKISLWGKRNKMELVEKSLSKAINYSMILAIPAMFGGILLGDKILYFVYGPEFSEGYMALVLILIAQLVNVFQYLFTTYLGALDFQKDSFKSTAVGAIGNLVLNVVLIPIIGITGAAFATLVTITLNALLASRYLSKIIDVKLDFPTLINMVVASCLMGIVVGAYRAIFTLSSIPMILISIILGAITYFLLLIKMDKKISDKLKKIVLQTGLDWPNLVK